MSSSTAEARVHTRTDWPNVPGGVLRRRALRGDQVELSCDVVVIGSGAGGAVVAAELAENGLDVIVLEEGGHHRTQDFNADAGAAVRRLYRDGGAQMALGSPPVTFAEGRCIGGSTVVNGGMSWRTPDKILERWRREDSVEGTDDLDRHFARVERFISARHQDPWTVGRDNELLREGADKKGWDVIPNVRNQLHCAGTNNCAFGCPTGAKRSTLVTYVPRALHHGARVLADCRVERVLFEGKRAVGVAGRATLAGGREGPRVLVRAGAVVVAAGAVQTPALLLRSGVRSPSGAIGHGLTLHPNAKVTAIFDEKVEGWKGVHQAYQVREFQDDGYLMAAVNIPPSMLAMTLPHWGTAMREVMEAYDRTVIAGILVEDTTTGRVRNIGGRPVAFYSLSDLDAARIVRGTSLLCELLFEAGAKRVVLPFEGVPDLLGPDEVRRLFQRPIAKSAMEVVTVHVMGTARMGEDRARHVCDSFGRVHDVDGLYVSDASLFPSPIGVNPMETIMALSTRNAERLLERWKR
jgi:choline dehydrogenase-like flavoprotein